LEVDGGVDGEAVLVGVVAAGTPNMLRRDMVKVF
jgi:hypothetical protein